jgi:hypothetical protein
LAETSRQPDATIHRTGATSAIARIQPTSALGRYVIVDAPGAVLSWHSTAPECRFSVPVGENVVSVEPNSSDT